MSIEMLDAAYKKFANKPNFNYLHYNIEQEYGLNQFDLIASNFSLQWLNDLPKFLKAIKTPYLLAIPVHGTFCSWQKLLKENTISNSGLHYHQPGQILDILNSDNRKTHSFIKNYKIKFDNPLMALRHLQNIGAIASDQTINIKNLMSMVRNNPATIELEYKVLYLVSL